MVKYIVPLVEEDGVIKMKYDVKRGKGIKVTLNIPAGVAVVESDKKISELEGKEEEGKKEKVKVE